MAQMNTFNIKKKNWALIAKLVYFAKDLQSVLCDPDGLATHGWKQCTDLVENL